MEKRYYKYTKAEVDYTSRAKKPEERCDKCKYYEMRRSCKLVRGDIDPEGWCNKFEPKK
jgi:hypothetical protein